jgi:hypothetical protein
MLTLQGKAISVIKYVQIDNWVAPIITSKSIPWRKRPMYQAKLAMKNTQVTGSYLQQTLSG